ncbi:hypothetical protein BJY04DRAFT_204200 [Aspergillus karnatakaensis]|uniref:uncharacterized protein n=1 Tax=Aspergillus karnatakaensis TaxID=1810916 RepID=UPI003CCE10F5
MIKKMKKTGHSRAAEENQASTFEFRSRFLLRFDSLILYISYIPPFYFLHLISHLFCSIRLSLPHILPFSLSLCVSDMGFSLTCTCITIRAKH